MEVGCIGNRRKSKEQGKEARQINLLWYIIIIIIIIIMATYLPTYLSTLWLSGWWHGMGWHDDDVCVVLYGMLR